MNNRNFRRIRRNQQLFYWMVLVIPIIHFFVFYVYLNFDGFFLAFKSYDSKTGQYLWTGFDNFKQVINTIKTVTWVPYAFENSILAWLTGTFFVFPVSVLTAYYVYKKRFLGEFFKVMLMIPDMISYLVMIMIYKFFMDRGAPELLAHFGIESIGLLADPETTRGTILFYTCFNGLNSGMLTYMAMMGGIPASLSEAAQMDGITPMKEYFYITLPMIWPVLSISLYGVFAGIINSDIGAFAFFAEQADYNLYSFSYYSTVELLKQSPASYGFLAALGLLFACFTGPLTFLGKHLVTKYGWSTD